MLTLDHQKLVNRDRDEIQKFLRCTVPSKRIEYGVLHEANDSCCKMEPWNLTAKFLLGAYRPDERFIMLNLHH